MAERINSYCTICGKGYHLCISCGSHKLTPWRAITDTSEHYKIHQILSAVICGVYSKGEAKEKLEKVDLSDIETYRDSVKNAIKDILNADYKQSVIEQFNNDTVNVEGAKNSIMTADANVVGEFETTLVSDDNEVSDGGIPKRDTKKKKKSNQIAETD